MAAFTTTSMMSAGRWWPVVFFRGMGHGHNILAAQYYSSHTTSVTPVEPPPPAGNGVLVFTTHFEYLATIPDEKYESCKHDTFVAMVHVKAPMATVVAGDDDARRRSVITAKDVWVEVQCNYHDLTITAVKSGIYKNDIIPREEASVSVGNLYADEERRFLFFLDAPRDDDVDLVVNNNIFRRLIAVRCSYEDAATELQITVGPHDEYVEELTSPEVEKERHRVEAAEDMAVAHKAAERGDFAEAERILAARRETVTRSAVAVAGDAKCKALVAELDELRRRVVDEREYKVAGRACFLASMKAHACQRGSAMFETPAMRKMEELWEMRRRQREEAPAPAPVSTKNGGSKDGPPARPRLEARLAAAGPRIRMLRRYRRLVPLIKR